MSQNEMWDFLNMDSSPSSSFMNQDLSANNTLNTSEPSPFLLDDIESFFTSFNQSTETALSTSTNTLRRTTPPTTPKTSHMKVDPDLMFPSACPSATNNDMSLTNTLTNTLTTSSTSTVVTTTTTTQPCWSTMPQFVIPSIPTQTPAVDNIDFSMLLNDASIIDPSNSYFVFAPTMLTNLMIPTTAASLDSVTSTASSPVSTQPQSWIEGEPKMSKILSYNYSAESLMSSNEEFRHWFTQVAPDQLEMTCKPGFTRNTTHKPRGSTHSVFVNDEITIHLPKLHSQFLSNTQIQLRAYLGNDKESGFATNISDLEDVTVVEFSEMMSTNVTNSTQSMNQIRVPIKRDNTSKRGKRKEKIILKDPSIVERKKKGETAPKKIIFMVIVDALSGQILYRSDNLWSRSKTKREMDKKKTKPQPGSLKRKECGTDENADLTSEGSDYSTKKTKL